MSRCRKSRWRRRGFRRRRRNFLTGIRLRNTNRCGGCLSLRCASMQTYTRIHVHIHELTHAIPLGQTFSDICIFLRIFRIPKRGALAISREWASERTYAHAHIAMVTRLFPNLVIENRIPTCCDFLSLSFSFSYYSHMCILTKLYKHSTDAGSIDGLLEQKISNDFLVFEMTEAASFHNLLVFLIYENIYLYIKYFSISKETDLNFICIQKK